MNFSFSEENNSREGDLILALHSCTETFGVAILDNRSTKQSLNSSTFSTGRSLSNKIFNCVEELLPASDWPLISRLSVAIGPGGYTGTRLAVVMARTLAQQLNCPLDGVSSFALMAPRVVKELQPINQNEPFWIVKDLPRRGLIGGMYKIKNDLNSNNKQEVIELEKPHLLSSKSIVIPSVQASYNVAKDVIMLLKFSLSQHTSKNQSNWRKVLPIYPTSPVESAQ